MKFSKRISVGKGVILNLSKSGISTTVGVKGLSTNFGKNGVHLNTSIPGTGLYNRHKIITGGKTNKIEINGKNYKIPRETMNKVFIYISETIYYFIPRRKT